VPLAAGVVPNLRCRNSRDGTKLQWEEWSINLRIPAIDRSAIVAPRPTALNFAKRVATESAVSSVGFSLTAKPLVNCGGSIAPEKGPRSKNVLTLATHSISNKPQFPKVRVLLEDIKSSI
jgi:hypothetical protein